MSLSMNRSKDLEVTANGDLRRDEMFYLTDVIILVEGCLFRVPRQPLEHEFEIFKTLFQLPIAEGSVPDGLSDQQPLRLDGISEADFRHLLLLLFPIKVDEHVFTVAEWTSILKLSTRWESDRLRKISISKISDLAMGAVDKLALAMEYDVKEWLIPTIAALVCRGAPMGIEEVKKIGIDNVLKIASIRECLHWNDHNLPRGWIVRRRLSVPGAVGNANADKQINDRIEEAFWEMIHGPEMDSPSVRSESLAEDET